MESAKQTKVSAQAIEKQLGDQINFLKKSCNSYDNGETSEYKRMATTLRVLLHNRGSSKSLISQLSLDSIFFPSFSRPSNPRNLLTEINLALIEMTDNGSKLVPVLDRGPSRARFLLFKNWWTESVLRDDQRVDFSRKDFVLTVANQDGGAHVYSEIETKYHRLINENSIGFLSSAARWVRLQRTNPQRPTRSSPYPPNKKPAPFGAGSLR